ncbi:MAG TPA: thiamine pyrophosphate-dependent enzyme [Candidatus Methylomirabilis sp.]|nr:thiamine pyrophosphate-dependent enzyme [Candidatus Methylomirabilis sp.]
MADEKNNLQVADVSTKAANTWCPGCGNFGIEIAMKMALVDLVNDGLVKKENLALVTGIGCHGKIADYLNINSFYSLHGRAFAPATGIKIANPALTVLAMAGDGDAYGEGLDHLIFAAKRNINLTALIHDNRVYALTTGQVSPTSPQKFRGKSTPDGSLDKPINPLELMLISGATFVARAFAGDAEFLKRIIKEAINHRGFSFIEVLQPCFTFFNTFEYYRENTYHLEDGRPLGDKEAALARAREWDYSDQTPAKIPLGIFYQKDEPTFDDLIHNS